MADSRWYDQSITRTKLHIARMIGQGKSNAALEAKKRLLIGMVMDPVDITRGV
jgi:hypothetical protein